MHDSNGFRPHNPLIVQGDRTLLLEVHNPLYEQARAAIGAFAELEKSPEHIHTYRITPLSLVERCRSRALGGTDNGGAHGEFAKYPVPQHVLADVRAWRSSSALPRANRLTARPRSITSRGRQSTQRWSSA